MVQSREYPNLRWIPPKSFTPGRSGYAVQFIVIHYTAGSEGPTSAEDGALYNQRRTDGTSAHYFVDRNSVVQGVLTKDRAHCARRHGNLLGIQYELCGTAQTRAQWLDAASRATLELAAKQAARDCRKYGIPVRRLSVAQTRAAFTEFPNGPKGFVGHVDCTYAFPEDNGDHTDPGVNFPWDIFLDMVRAELAPKEWSDMATEQEIEDAAYRGTFRFFSDAYEAATGAASKDTTEDRQKRNARDFLRGVVGGPTEDDVAKAQAAIEAKLAEITDITLTPEQSAQVAAAAADAVRPAVTKIDSLRHHLGDNDPVQA